MHQNLDLPHEALIVKLQI